MRSVFAVTNSFARSYCGDGSGALIISCDSSVATNFYVQHGGGLNEAQSDPWAPKGKYGNWQ
jgi:hypothetical protein